MKRSLSLIALIIVLIVMILMNTVVYAVNEDVTLEEVDDTVCDIKLDDNGEVKKHLVSVDDPSKEIVLQVDVTNLKNVEEDIIPTEMFFVIDNSLSMIENKLEDGTTRKDAVFSAAKELAKKILENQASTKIGIVSFSTSDTNEGTLDDATLELMPSNNINQIDNAIDGIQATGARTDIDAGLQVARDSFSTETNLNKYLILLTDGVPNTAVGGPTMTYSGEVTTKTRETLQSVLDRNINIVTVMTGVDPSYMPDPYGNLSPDAANKTYLNLAEEIFGTQETPNYGKFYYVTDENVTNTITENVYSDVIIIKKNEIRNITVVDYFPANILENYDYEILEQPNVGQVTAQVNYDNNSITWYIENLPAGATATFKYKLTLKENFNEEIINVVTPTNEKVDVTYTDPDGNTKTESSDDSPSVILIKEEEPEENIPEENVPEENVPEENVPVENVPVENVPVENTPVENIPKQNEVVHNLVDNTVAPGKLPQTGDTMFYIITILLVGSIGVFIYNIKNRKEM